MSSVYLFLLCLTFTVKEKLKKTLEFLWYVTLAVHNFIDSPQDSSLRMFCLTADGITLAVNPICRESVFKPFDSAYCTYLGYINHI
jgi:hypothetical protein